MRNTIRLQENIIVRYIEYEFSIFSSVFSLQFYTKDIGEDEDVSYTLSTLR